MFPKSEILVVKYLRVSNMIAEKPFEMNLMSGRSARLMV